MEVAKHTVSISEADLADAREETIARGKQIYDEKLKAVLEPEQIGRYVAIDPETERYFLGDTSAEALVAAHGALPDSRFYLARVGYKAAHTIGGYGLSRR
jgi:hypothetical protein